MNSFLLPKLLRAKDPIDLFVQVQKNMAAGMDLQGQIFIDEGLICQWMESDQSFYEYRLIQAIDSDDLEQQVVRFSSEGFDMFGNTVLWNAKRLQWMFRYVRHESQREVMATTGRLDQVMFEKDQSLVSRVATIVVGGEPKQVTIGEHVELQIVESTLPLFRHKFMGDSRT